MTYPTIKMKITPAPKLRGKMDVRFPANVEALSPILLDKSGGTYTFSFDADAISGNFATAAQGALADSAIQSVVAGSNVTVDNTDPRNPVVSASSSSVPWITPEQFGAVGDDTADDYAAFAAAVQEMIDTGAMLRLSAKRYLLKSKLEIEVDAEQSISIQGAGSQASVLRFADPADGGIEYTSTTVVPNRKPKLSLVGFTVSTTNQDCGTAIRASWADDVQLNAPLFIDDCVVAQDLVHTSDQGSDYGYWTDGIHVTNARNSTIRETFGLGELHLSPGSQSFIKLDGECTDFRLEGVRGVEWDKAIYAGGTSEGIVLTGGFSLVYCNYGFYADYAGGEPHIVLEGGHINAMLKNIYLSNVLDYQIRGVNLTASSAFNTAPYPDWIGIHVLGANTRGGYIGAGTCISKEAGRSGGTQIGIKIDTGKRHIIDPIEIYSPDSNFIGTGILIDNSVTNSQVAYPIVENVTTPVNMGTGATNRLVTNAALRADSSGNVRMANNVSLLARNAADSGNLALIGADTNDNVAIGSGLFALSKTLFAGTHLVPIGHQTYNFGGLTAQWNVGYFKSLNVNGWPSGASIRERLSANRTYYVRTDGDDSNTGLANTSGGAFLTIQKALDVIYGTLDLSGFNATIQLGNTGTRTENIVVGSPQVGAGNVILSGDTNSANTGSYIVTSSSGDTFVVKGFAVLNVQGIEVRSAAGSGLTTQNSGAINILTYIQIGSCASTQIRANNGTIDASNATIGITAAAATCISASPRGYLNFFQTTFNIPSGTFAYTQFALADRLGLLSCNGATINNSGTVTGTRYNVNSNAVIFTNGGGASFFPGSIAGTDNSGAGRYV